MTLHKEILKLDSKSEVDRICKFIKDQTVDMRKDGIVIGLSGGIDSALAAELCVKAVGKENVFGLILPETDSNPISAKYAKKQAEGLGIAYEIIDISPTLKGFGTYEKRDAAIKQVFPEYNENYKLKITLPSDLLDKDTYNIFTLTSIY